MPYKSIDELPTQTKDLPTKGKQMFMATFNDAFSGSCKDKGDSQESCAMAISWASIKNRYEQDKDGKWTEKKITSAEAPKYTPADMKAMLQYMIDNPDMMDASMVKMMETAMGDSEGMMSSKKITSEAMMSAKPIKKKNEIIVSFVKDNTIGTRADGKQLTLTKEALQKHHKSWEGKRLSINHDPRSNIGKIAETWYDDGFVYGRMTDIPDEVMSMIGTAAFKGVSEEALPIEFDDKGNISTFEGLGNTLIFFPIEPQCSPKDGCKIIPEQIASAVPEDKKNCLCVFSKWKSEIFKQFSNPS